MDIDLDSEGGKRERIMERTVERFGEENVLTMATFSTEGTKSAVKTACRGLGIDGDVAQNLSNMIPMERGINWSIEDAFFGNEEKERQPSKIFIDAVNEAHPRLKDQILGISKLISGRGAHASGVIISPHGYIDHQAMMRTKKGIRTTQFDMGDTAKAGGLKYDYLSINALDKIHQAMIYMLQDGAIEWKGSLRETYNEYFHPDKLEMEASEMFDMLFEGVVTSAFQFEGIVNY